LRILVTGAAGFLGACITEQGVKAGHSVVAIARSKLPYFLNDLKNLEFQKCDLVNTIPNGQDYDLIVHCAASIPSREPNPDLLFDYNVKMGKSVVSCARNCSSTTIINMSSMSAFGPINEEEVNEKTPTNPQDAYGKSKLLVEGFIRDWCSETGGVGVSMRLPGMVGGRSHANFMSNLAEQLIRKEPVVVTNPDGFFNNIVYGYDLAQFVIDRVKNIPSGYKTLTIASDNALLVREAAERVATAAGASPDLINYKLSKTKPFMIRFDEIRALGYQPASVESSIDRFVNDKNALLR
tara:strand:- start:2262 stop:3146 length:885 start_codon:yes stop_codon:yes gene_type:complete